MSTLRITQIGNSLGVILPKEILTKLRVEKGETLYVVDAADGILLTAHDPAFASEMEAARKVMKKRRAVLRELAK